MTPERKAFIDSLLAHCKPSDIQEMLKDLLGDTLQGMLEAEMDDSLFKTLYLPMVDDTENEKWTEKSWNSVPNGYHLLLTFSQTQLYCFMPFSSQSNHNFPQSSV